MNDDLQVYLKKLLKWCYDIKDFQNFSEKCVPEKRLKEWESELNLLINNIKNFWVQLDSTQFSNYEASEYLSKLKERADKIYNWCEEVCSASPSFERILTKEVSPIKEVPIGKHTLPPLPYAYDALEPIISKEIMRLHHDKHHRSYVEGLNKAEKKIEEARQKGDYELIKHWEREISFNGAGHFLHTIFWGNMKPKGSSLPSGNFSIQIDKDFGSFKKFKEHFSAAAKKVEGVGWAILVWAPRSRRLTILQAEKHQNLSQWDVVPLLVLDVWEHAYYLQYKTDKDSYVNNWWHVVNWNNVAERFDKSRRLQWVPY